MSKRLAMHVVRLLTLVCLLCGCTEDDGQGAPQRTSTTVTVAPVAIEAADITVITEPLALSDGTSLLPAGELPTTLPDLDHISSVASRQLADNPEAVGPEVFFGLLERGSSNTVGDGAVVLAVRLYGVLVVPSCPAGASCAGPVPSIDTTFYEATTGKQVLEEQIGCDPTGCAVPKRA